MPNTRFGTFDTSSYSESSAVMELSRRRFVMGGAALAAGLLARRDPGARGTTAARASDDNPYAPFRMGIQSYSLRAFPVEIALVKTQALGLTWWEGFETHFPITDDPKEIERYRDMLAAHGIDMPAFGVVDFTHNEADARRKFAFARAMRIRTLSAHPWPDSFDLMDRLVSEYRINIGIHNHGPGDELYGTPEKVLAAIRGHDHRIGACDDTGHYLRLAADPVAAARAFGSRLYGVHLKDVKDGPDGGKQFTEIGKGNLDIVGLMRVLKSIRYDRRGIISLEYEEHAEDPIRYIVQCLVATRAAIRGAT